jgi:co-chaperonin GroES (HSP10)
MAVGPDAYKRGRAPLRAGSRVLIGRQAGTDVKIGGIEYVIVRASDLLALVMA